jgi:hypothetical protein
MAETWIEPDGVMPAAGVLQTIYTVPEDKALMWNLHVCPQGGLTKFTVERAPEGEARADKHRVFYDEPVDRAYQAVVGFTAVAGTEIRVSSADGAVSFQLSGILRDQT